jgi:uncharacterized RDD family membrane protein YckC
MSDQEQLPEEDVEEPLARPIPDATDFVRGTIVPRHFAATADILFAIILAMVVGACLPEENRLLQVVVMTFVVLAYYFLSEGILSTTPAKLMAGLAVLQLDRTRITWGQALVRTLFRLIEVNPLLFGAIPAALSIVFSKHCQRIGDRVAMTYVVRAKHMKR